jgi:hypothetical protein
MITTERPLSPRDHEVELLLHEAKRRHRVRRTLQIAATVLVVATILLALDAAGVPLFGPSRASSKAPVNTGSLSPQGSVTPRFFQPAQVAFSGSTVWITNPYSSQTGPSYPSGRGYIDELIGNTGHLVRVLDVRQDGLEHPSAIVANRRFVWVEDMETNRVAQLRTSDGALVQVFASPWTASPGYAEMALCGGSLWVDTGNKRLAEMTAVSGRVERILSLRSEGVSSPSNLMSEGSRLWVSDSYTTTFTELNCLTGSVIRTIHSAVNGGLGVGGLLPAGNELWISGDGVFQISQTDGDTVAGIHNASFGQPDVWVAAIQGNSLWMLEATGAARGAAQVVSLSTGQLIRDIRLGNFDQPTAMGIDGGKAWILDGDGVAVDVFDAKTGAPIWHFGRKWPRPPSCGCLP